MKANILICGIGGQGTVLSSKLLSEAALLSRLSVLSAETIGMAQRGGSVISHVRIGENFYSPLIPLGQADMIIAFELCEAVRNFPYLKRGGVLVVNKKIVLPSVSLNKKDAQGFSEKELISFLESTGGVLCLVDAPSICKELGTDKVVNTILLGSALREGIGIDIETMKEAILKTVKPSFSEMNINALMRGFGGKKDET